jgi:hypothetical protein
MKIVIAVLIFLVPFAVGIIGKRKEVQQIIVFALVFLTWELVPFPILLLMVPFNQIKEAIQKDTSIIGNITLFALVLTLVVMMVLYGETTSNKSIDDKRWEERFYEQHVGGAEMARERFERMMEEREKEIKDYQDRPFDDR